ncbi:MAG: MFS transporter [Bacillota bacterium]
MAMGLLVNAISVVGIGLSTSWPVTLSLQFLNGLFMPCIHIGVNTMILKLTAEEYVGRVNGVLNPLFIGAMVITMSLAGWLKIQFSLVAMYGVSGMLFFVGMLLTVPLLKGSVFKKTDPVVADGIEIQ